MMVYESLFYRGKPAGRMFFDSDTGIYRYSPNRCNDPDLDEIAAAEFTNPDDLRRAVLNCLEARSD